MKVYSPVGYYNDPEDIMDLFPCSLFKGDEADIVVNAMHDLYGNFHEIDNPEVDACISPADASKSKDLVFSSDGMYIVVFSRGDTQALRRGDDMHGFFIDVYHLEEVPGYAEYEAELNAPVPEPDIKKMSYDELYEYTLNLSKKVKEAVQELTSRR
jgi:hypothetical protein